MQFGTDRLKTVKPSASATISLTAKAMRAAGEDVIDLGLGEPDFDTPSHITEAAYEAAKAGETRYPPTGGSASLKAAVRRKFARDNDLTFDDNEIIISNGAKQVIFDAFMATLEAGDEVILCAPYFDSYRNIISLLGGVRKVAVCKPEEAFRLTPAMLESLITDRTRWLLLNAPSNPAGACYTADDFRALGDVLKRYPDVLVMADEIYEHILFDGQSFTSFVAVCPELVDRVLTVNGVSKAYAMTGWRIGYGAGPAELIKAMVTVQSQVSSGACSVAQAAAVAALDGPQESVQTFCDAFARRRDLVVKGIADVPGLSLVKPAGAFYALISCESYLGRQTPGGEVITDDAAFVSYLLNDARVAAVPGSEYEMPGYFRLSTACADEVLVEAIDRIKHAVEKL